MTVIVKDNGVTKLYCKVFHFYLLLNLGSGLNYYQEIILKNQIAFLNKYGQKIRRLFSNWFKNSMHVCKNTVRV